MGILFCLIFFPIALICAFGVPVLMGVLVYRDAVKRDTNPWLWALVAALVPSFIGLLIYLLVRGDYAVLAPGQQRSGSYQQNAQSAWGNGVGGDANANAEGSQGSPDDAFEYRTYTNADGETFTQRVPKKKPGLPTWAKVLIGIGIALVVIALIALIIGVAKYILGYGVATYYNGFPL